MNNITLDIETKSDKDLTKCGVYAYAESEYFDILLFAYSVDGGDVIVIDTACGEKIPAAILAALTDENIIKQAFNVNFERICLSAYIRKHYPEYFKGYGDADDTVGDYLNPRNWQCTMIHSRYLGLPSSLAQVGEVLKIKDEKMAEGKALIRYFCVPYAEKDGIPQFHHPMESPAKWKLFKTYNKRDVEAEMEIDQKLEKFPVPDFVWEEFYIDQTINDRGIAVDMALALSAIQIDETISNKLSKAMCRLTGVENPNSVYQLLDWLETQGLKSDSLGKKEVQELIKTADEPVRTVLAMRLQLSKSSVKKYQAMQNTACSDGRARGMFSFYGASRTGRWAGRSIQLQNLPQNHLPDLSEARGLVKTGDEEMISLLYDDIPDTLSQLIRTAFIPREGYKFIVSDYSAIEARVIAWLADEKWRMEAFEKGEDIYCASASQMFGVPVEKHGINGHLRQKGKVAELACGYGGSVGAMKAMGADSLGLSDAELKQIVDDWRASSPSITDLWWAVDSAVKKAIKTRGQTETHGLTFTYQSGFLFITLPSGRRLAYVKPRIGENQFGGESVVYRGLNQQKKWDLLESYGPKFVENIVQAIARDILCYSMQTLSGCSIVGHVHDELIIECPQDVTVKQISDAMAKNPPWAEGLLLRAEGYECQFYQKD